MPLFIGIMRNTYLVSVSGIDGKGFVMTERLQWKSRPSRTGPWDCGGIGQRAALASGCRRPRAPHPRRCALAPHERGCRRHCRAYSHGAVRFPFPMAPSRRRIPRAGAWYVTTNLGLIASFVLTGHRQPSVPQPQVPGSEQRLSGLVWCASWVSVWDMASGQCCAATSGCPACGWSPAS